LSILFAGGDCDREEAVCSQTCLRNKFCALRQCFKACPWNGTAARRKFGEFLPAGVSRLRIDFLRPPCGRPWIAIGGAARRKVSKGKGKNFNLWGTTLDECQGLLPRSHDGGGRE